MHHADLVIVFSSPTWSFSKSRTRKAVKQAQEQYTRLIRLLANAGLIAVGKPGRRQGEVLILIRASKSKLKALATSERKADFINGLTVSELDDNVTLTPAIRTRLIHTLISCPANEGGLGVVPLSPEWSNVDSMLAVHDPEFNATWVRALARGTGEVNLDKVKDQYGESIALYFAFLSAYKKSLTSISAIGALLYLSKAHYSAYHSVVLLIWSTFFVEYWSVRERKFSVKWHTKGVDKVEKPRAQYREHQSGWVGGVRKLVTTTLSYSMLLAFIIVLGCLLTGFFALETIVAPLYSGPGRDYALTNLENHKYASTYEASIAIKRFALLAIPSYLGLAFSAFVYMPFGEHLLGLAHFHIHDPDMGIWEPDAINAITRLDTSRLQKQMFTFCVTAQIGNTFGEIGAPYLVRFGMSIYDGSWFRAKAVAVSEEDKYIERLRDEVGLAEHDLYDDYAELLVQFGYVAVWSIVWPLAPVMALLNNWLEESADAFKLTVHLRKSIPRRAESIGPWLSCLRWVTWLAAIVNALLAYVLSERFASASTKLRLVWVAIVGLSASHGCFALQRLANVLAQRLLWKNSNEELEVIKIERRAKEAWLSASAPTDVEEDDREEALDEFWVSDEGLEEIRRDLKDA